VRKIAAEWARPIARPLWQPDRAERWESNRRGLKSTAESFLIQLQTYCPAAVHPLGRYDCCQASELLADTEVSRVHALIIQVRDRLLAINTASSNRQFLDGRPVSVAELRDGAMWMLGASGRLGFPSSVTRYICDEQRLASVIPVRSYEWFPVSPRRAARIPRAMIARPG
jgi:hypothetical protein